MTKKKSVIIVFIILALMILTVFLDSKSAGVLILCYVIPFFASSFACFGLLTYMAGRNSGLAALRQRMITKGTKTRILLTAVPLFLVIIAAQQVFICTAAENLIRGAVLGIIFGIPTFFTNERFF